MSDTGTGHHGAASDWPKIRTVGVDGMLVSFGDRLSEPANRAALAFRAALDRAANTASLEVLAGGGYDDSTGYFVEPTVLVGTETVPPDRETPGIRERHWAKPMTRASFMVSS